MDMKIAADQYRYAILDWASIGGFRVRFRSKGIKCDERDAVYLADMTEDPSSHFRLGQRVRIGSMLIPSGTLDIESSDYLQNQLEEQEPIWIAGFVEVHSRVGKLALKHLYCCLFHWNRSIYKDQQNKVNLFWIGSLEPNPEAD